MNLGMYLVVIFGVLIGGLPTLFIAISAPAIILWKIYRKIHYNIPIMD